MRFGIVLSLLFFSMFVSGQDTSTNTLSEIKFDSKTQLRIDSIKQAGFKKGSLENSTGDSILTSKPKKVKKVDTSYYSPKKAALHALAFPGLGQIYNKKYWKLPIVYGLLGGAIYFVTSQSIQLRKYNEYITLREGGGQDPYYDILTIEELVDERDYYRRNVQLASFATLFVWGLAIVDATVDAHMRSFDVSDKLSLQIKPKVGSINNETLYAGLNINFKLK